MSRRAGYDPSPVGYIPPVELGESELDDIKENFVMFDKDGDGGQFHSTKKQLPDHCCIHNQARLPQRSWNRCCKRWDLTLVALMWRTC